MVHTAPFESTGEELPIAACAAGLGLLVAWAAALCWWDLSARRLPNWLTLPAGVAAVLALFQYPSWAVGLVWPGVYLAQALLPGPAGRLGGGDIKLALPLGVGCAAVAGAAGVLAAMVIAGLVTLVAGLICTAAGRDRNAGRRGVPHGPAMLFAAAAVAAGRWVATPIM